MTREEAIWRLENCLDCTDCFTCGSHDDALVLAVAALREQEERSKGCDRCSEKLSKDFPFSPAERQRLTLHSKHCAWCGRKLEVEQGVET